MSEQAQIDPCDHVAVSKNIRQGLDHWLQYLKDSSGDRNSVPIPTENQRRSRERSIAITKLQEAIMWMGMDLKSINESNPGAAPNPYPKSYDPSSPVIEPTADGLKL